MRLNMLLSVLLASTFATTETKARSAGETFVQDNPNTASLLLVGGTAGIVYWATRPGGVLSGGHPQKCAAASSALVHNKVSPPVKQSTNVVENDRDYYASPLAKNIGESDAHASEMAFAAAWYLGSWRAFDGLSVNQITNPDGKVKAYFGYRIRENRGLLEISLLGVPENIRSTVGADIIKELTQIATNNRLVNGLETTIERSNVKAMQFLRQNGFILYRKFDPGRMLGLSEEERRRGGEDDPTTKEYFTFRLNVRG